MDTDQKRREIDKLAAYVAAERGCTCGGARNCGCWNKALRLLCERRTRRQDGI